MTPMPDEHDARVFVNAEGRGGNRTIVVAGSVPFDAEYARGVARRWRGECTCIHRDAATPRLRFFLPTGEMAFCGHGLLGAAAVLHGESPHEDRFAVRVGDTTYELAISNRDGRFVEVMSTIGEASAVGDALSRVAFAALGLDPSRGTTWPVVNAGTDRPKTLIPLRSVEALHSIRTSEARVAQACALLDTTGLFPFVHTPAGGFDARQFPRNAGFLEDAASGTAAIALASAYGPVYPRDEDGSERAFQIRQGAAMGAPSELFVRWHGARQIALGGRVRIWPR